MSRPEPATIAETIDIIKRRTADGGKVPFSISFVTYDEDRKDKPSRHIKLAQAEECGAAHNLVRHDQVGVRPCAGGHQYAVQLILITHINGRPVA